MLSNPIRQNAPETFAYFAKQGVEVKVISGDNPVRFPTWPGKPESIMRKRMWTPRS